LLGAGNRRAVAVALLPILAMAALLAPIALEQREHAHAGWIASQPPGRRLERAAAKLLGSDNGSEHGKRASDPIPLAVPLALALASIALLLTLGSDEERRGARVAAATGAIALAVPLLLALLGSDYLDGRNLLPVFVPLLIVLGAGFGVERAGFAGLGLAAAFCLCGLAFTLEIDRLPRLQREDLRNAAAQVGELKPDEAVVTDRYAAGWPLRYYLDAHPASALPRLREIVLVGSASAAEEHAHRILPAAFHEVEARPVSYDFTLSRYRSSRLVRVSLHRLERGALVGGRASVLVGP